MEGTFVSVVDNANPANLVKNALDLIGIKTKIKTDMQVLIKPNFTRIPSNSPYIYVKGAYEKTLTPDGDVTHREIIEGLLKALTELNIKRIIIGEAPGGCEASVVFKALALYELAEEYGVELVDLNHSEALKVPVQNGFILKEVWIPKVVLQSDFRISLANMKVHGASCLTLCLKNWAIGIPPGKYYGAPKGWPIHYKGLEEPLPIHPKNWQKNLKYGQSIDLAKVIVDICSVRSYELGIIDALTVQDYNTLAKKVLLPGRIRQKNMVLASTDMVAIDAVAARIMGFDPSKILHIQWASEKGLGVADLSRIEVLGKNIEEIEMRCLPMYLQRNARFPRQHK